MAGIGKTLRNLRQAAGLTQKEVARRISHALAPITHQAVSKWETGDAQPNVQQFLMLCRLYGVQDVLGTFCPEAQGPALNGKGLAKLKEYEQLLLASGLYAPSVEAPAPAPAAARRPRFLRLYDLPASAGTGQFLDGESYEWVQADDTVPTSADFGVHITGDSMEPRFQDGQVVWVQERTVIEQGEIGLFLYDGEAYCKQFCVRQGNALLVSLNPDYAPIQVAGELRVFGRVVSG